MRPRREADNCYDPTIISELIDFPYPEQIDSFRPGGSRSLHPGDRVRSIATLEIFSPTNTPGTYEDHFRNFCLFGDKGGVWQVSLNSCKLTLGNLSSFIQ